MNSDVYIVDDDPAVRDSLSVLMAAHGFNVHVFRDGEAFLREDLSQIEGPVLLDVRMPGRDGLEILKEALAINPGLAIVIMSGHGDIPMAVRALKRGAKSFIEKPFKAAGLLEEFAQLQKLLTATRNQQVEHAAIRDRLLQLTPRENEVMDHLVQGKPNKIIADDLGLSVRTVEVHRANLLSKLGIRSLSDLVRISLLSSQSHNY